MASNGLNFSCQMKNFYTASTILTPTVMDSCESRVCKNLTCDHSNAIISIFMRYCARNSKRYFVAVALKCYFWGHQMSKAIPTKPLVGIGLFTDYSQIWSWAGFHFIVFSLYVTTKHNLLTYLTFIVREVKTVSKLFKLKNKQFAFKNMNFVETENSNGSKNCSKQHHSKKIYLVGQHLI